MKKIFMTMLVVLVVIGMGVNIYAKVEAPVLTQPGYNASEVSPTIQEPIKNVWSTVVILVQFVAVGCVVFAGVRYMFASADQKADIKQGLIFLVIGAVLVFGAVTIIQFVTNAANEIL